MTTPTISASNPRSGASGAKAREGGSADGKSFSTVLSLRMGMGLNAAVGVAPNVPVLAQKMAAEPARGPEAAEQSARGEELREPERTNEVEASAASEPVDETDAEADIPELSVKDGRKELGAGKASGEPAELASSKQSNEINEPKPTNEGPGAVEAKVDAAKAVKVTQAPVAAVESLPAEASARDAVKAAVDATAPVHAAANMDAPKGVEPRVQAGTRAAVGPAGGAAEAVSKSESRIRGSGEAEPRVTVKKDAETEPATVARDPLGLIRERAPEAEVVTKHPKQEREAAPDLSGSRMAQPEVTRTRFADAEETASASRVLASGGVPAQSSQVSTPTFAPVAASRAAGAAGVGSVGGVGGAAVGSGGTGGGASGGDFGGLFGGGRAFGAVFGATVRKGASSVAGAASTKGESKEQIQAQISRGLAAALRQKGGVMSLRLNPEHLGSMKIDLTIESGRVTAVFDAQSEQARQILRDGVEGLKRSIEQTGLVVKSIEVAGVTTLTPPEPVRGGERAFHGTTDQQGGQDLGRQGGEGSGRDQRGGEGTWAGDESDGLVDVHGVNAGGVWAEEDGSASGLLRLRVDAVV